MTNEKPLMLEGTVAAIPDKDWEALMFLRSETIDAFKDTCKQNGWPYLTVTVDGPVDNPKARGLSTVGINIRTAGHEVVSAGDRVQVTLTRPQPGSAAIASRVHKL